MEQGSEADFTDTITAIWDRDDDTDRSWVAFQIYRNMHPGERTILKAYLAYRSSYDPDFDAENFPHSAPPGSFSQWSTDYDWRLRAEAYDRYLDIVSRHEGEREHVDQLADYRARSLEFAKQAQESARKMMEKINKRLAALEPEEITAGLIPKYIQSVAVLFDKAAEAEARALAVDRILEELDAQNRLKVRN